MTEEMRQAVSDALAAMRCPNCGTIKCPSNGVSSDPVLPVGSGQVVSEDGLCSAPSTSVKEEAWPDIERILGAAFARARTLANLPESPDIPSLLDE